MKIRHNLNAIVTIAFRDFIKFIRDGRRLAATFIFPFIFVGIVGFTFQQGLGDVVSFNFQLYTFTGILAQTLFQSAAGGLISLVQDRAEDFAQELFITPVPRYIILTGKIIGESMVAIAQAIGILLFGVVIGVSFSLTQVLVMIPVFILVPVFGGAFGILVMSNLDDPKAVNQIFPFLLLPQYFLAGVFNPIGQFSGFENFDIRQPLEALGILGQNIIPLLSKIAPLTYPVDMTRYLFNLSLPEAERLPTVNSPEVNILVMVVMFVVFLSLGTYIFVKNERNR